MLLDGCIIALLLLCGVSAVTVSPPTDVNVSCHNFKTKVSWKYSKQPQTRFRVRVVGSDAKRYENETTDHQYDLSHFVWESEEHCMDYHYITVTAIQGENQSTPVKSKSFSFNRLKTPHVRCLLEFPSVDLTVGESGATVSFPNPLHLYKELNQVTKQNGVSLKFSISTESENFDASCTVEDRYCRHDISFPEGVEQYVTLTGKLCNRDCLGEVEFRKTERIYPSNLANVLVVTLALMLGILVFIIIVVAVIICKVKGWTMNPFPEKPTCLILDAFYGQLLTYDPGFNEEIVTVNFPNSDERCKKPSDSSEEDYSTRNLRDSSNSLNSQSPEEGYKDGGVLEDSNQELGSRGHRTDDDSTGDSEQTECVSISSEENKSNEGYDMTHCHLDTGN